MLTRRKLVVQAPAETKRENQGDLDAIVRLWQKCQSALYGDLVRISDLAELTAAVNV